MVSPCNIFYHDVGHISINLRITAVICLAGGGHNILFHVEVSKSTYRSISPTVKTQLVTT
jgi:hypothetical protein